MSKPFVFFIIVLGIWGIFSLIPFDWSTWAPATCLQTGCFCERIDPGGMAQPVNSWSSLAFCLPGLLVLFDRSKPHSFTARPSYRWIFGLALLVIGLGSAFYHASLTFTGQFFDVIGMYLFISFAVVYCLARLDVLPEKWFAWVYVTANLVFAGILIWLPVLRRELFLFLVLAALALEGVFLVRRQPGRPALFFAGAVGSLAAAYLIWIMDNSGTWCVPDSILQGHAAWHILGALSAWLLYQYYKKI